MKCPKCGGDCIFITPEKHCRRGCDYICVLFASENYWGKITPHCGAFVCGCETVLEAPE